ncbi:unnamed protein product [Schistosoma turkestanicum]|nr:unnamed protein product [Schistosoma turkestanicum]
MLNKFNCVVLLKWYIVTITIVQLFNFQLTHQAVYQNLTREKEEVGKSNFPIELLKDIYVYQYSESIKYDEVSPVSMDKAATVTLGEYQTLIVKPIFKIWYEGLDMDYVEIFPSGCNITTFYPVEIIKTFNEMPTTNTIKTIHNKCNLTSPYPIELIKVFNAMPTMNTIKVIHNVIYDNFYGKRNEQNIPQVAVKSGTLVEYRPLPVCKETGSYNLLQDLHCQEYTTVHSSFNCWLNNSKFCSEIKCSETTDVYSEESNMNSSSIPSTESTATTEPTTFSTTSSTEKQRTLVNSQTMNVNMEFRRFTVALLMPFLLIAGVVCIAFPVFLHKKHTFLAIRWSDLRVYNEGGKEMKERGMQQFSVH